MESKRVFFVAVKPTRDPWRLGRWCSTQLLSRFFNGITCNDCICQHISGKQIQDDDFLLQAHLPWIWNHYKPQIDQPQVSKKKCHFNRMEFTILFLRLPQNVSILYKQKTHLTNIHLLSPNTKDSNNEINLPSKKCSHQLFQQVGIDSFIREPFTAGSFNLGGYWWWPCCLDEVLPWNDVVSEVSLVVLGDVSWKKMRIFVWSFSMFTWCLFFPWAKPKENELTCDAAQLHLWRNAEQQKKNVETLLQIDLPHLINIRNK